MNEPASITTLLIGAITVLAGCVTYLYQQQRTSHLDTIKRLADCEDDRLKLWQQIAGIKNVSVKELREGNE